MFKRSIGHFIDKQRDINRMYLYAIMRSANFWLPTVILFYQDGLKLSFAEFMFAQAVFAGAIMLFEVPSGYLSDIWSRRRVMVASVSSWLVAHLILLQASSLWEALIVEIIMAFGYALSSGTTQAMLYEYLAEQGREHEFRKVEGKRFALGFYTLGISALPGGVLYAINIYLPIWLSVATDILALIIALGMREPTRIKEEDKQENPLKDVLSTLRYALHGHKEIAAIILMAVVVFTSTKLVMWAQQPYYEASGIPVAWFGVLSFISLMMVGAFSQNAHRLERWVDSTLLMGLIILTQTAIGLVAGVMLWPGLAVLLLVGQAIYGLASTVVTDIITQRANPSRRATTLSAMGLVQQGFGMLVTLLYAGLAAQGVGDALVMVSLMVGLFGLPSWLILRARMPSRKKLKSQPQPIPVNSTQDEVKIEEAELV